MLIAYSNIVLTSIHKRKIPCEHYVGRDTNLIRINEYIYMREKNIGNTKSECIYKTHVVKSTNRFGNNKGKCQALLCIKGTY